MKVLIVILTVLFLLAGGCTTDSATGKKSIDPQKVAMGMAALHNALALAQIGYQDYALVAGKNADPKTLAAMQIIDSQLNILGALAYNTANPSADDIAKAQAALLTVQQAKQTINPILATK